MSQTMPNETPDPVPGLSGARASMRRNYRIAEPAHLDRVSAELDRVRSLRSRINERARSFVEGMREGEHQGDVFDDFMNAYDLSTREGVALMCLAEALLRIPDADTANQLIKDKLGAGTWKRVGEEAGGLFVNASTWALMLSGRVLRADHADEDEGTVFDRMVARLGQPVIRRAMLQAMRIMGRQFVIGTTLTKALERAEPDERKGVRHSYDMLGEAARTEADAQRYFDAYSAAIKTLTEHNAVAISDGVPVTQVPGISVKLSAIYPRYEQRQAGRAVPALIERLTKLAVLAKHANIGLCVDAEEARRLDISLDIIERVYKSPELEGWDGFGLAVQAYQKRALDVIDWLIALGEQVGRRIMVRLVKGAYWDSEIKWSQEGGFDDYPVFTRKQHTDLSYLACATRMLARRDVLYPQFATHNTHTVAAILELAANMPEGGNESSYEFQRLHGMGEDLYAELAGSNQPMPACRVYAPVGSHEDLLPYLVRRLLENGANTSFVNRLQDAKLPVEQVVRDPLELLEQSKGQPHAKIPLPPALYGVERVNAKGLDLDNVLRATALQDEAEEVLKKQWQADPLIDGKHIKGEMMPVALPSDLRRTVGQKHYAAASDVPGAVEAARAAFHGWRNRPVAERAACLELFADLMEANMGRLIGLCAVEAGKTFDDGIAEVREAVDFCRYYAIQARGLQQPMTMPGPTGEVNTLSVEGRGVFVCISPWNFPLAIFTGQVVAALVTGNCVIAKPAEQTCLIAAEACRMLHEAGIPRDVLQLLPGSGGEVGQALVSHPGIGGVAFTGSTETARAINRALANREGPIVPLIAETGGQNAMIVDSTALTEQVVDDAVMGAFRSAGQRCSATRVLFVQEEVADHTIKMLAGAMELLKVGEPLALDTDVGPVIDRDAQHMLEAHVNRMKREAKLVGETPLDPKLTEHGTYVAPMAFEIDRLDRLKREVFGPILHIIRYKRDRLDEVIQTLNGTGYGLTFGVHTRIERLARSICRRIDAGNAYINRNTIGAIVGVQPFGGMGLSGTGPKAGGPHYLHAFVTERHVSNNTTAAGGNTSLVTLDDDDAE